MRSMSALLQEVISQDHVTAFLLVQIGPFENNSYIRSTTLPYNFVFNGVTYVSDARILSTELPKLSSSVDRSSYKVLIGDPQFNYRETIERGATGVALNVQAGFINTLGETRQGTPPNEPFDTADMVFTLYKGKLDTQMYTINTDSEIILSLEGSSPMGALGLKRTLLTSRDWMRQRFPTDTSFDQVFIGSSSQVLLWGKKPGGETE